MNTVEPCLCERGRMGLRTESRGSKGLNTERGRKGLNTQRVEGLKG